jgi:hypothetical protein
MQKPASLIAILFIALIAVGHLLRIVFNIDFVVYDISIPMWASGAAAVFCGFLAVWLWKEIRG